MMFGTKLPNNIPYVSKIYKVRNGEAICKTLSRLNGCVNFVWVNGLPISKIIQQNNLVTTYWEMKISIYYVDNIRTCDIINKNNICISIVVDKECYMYDDVVILATAVMNLPKKTMSTSLLELSNMYLSHKISRQEYENKRRKLLTT